MMDLTSEAGALLLKRRLEQYCRDRGEPVPNFRIEPVKVPHKANGAHFAVLSDLKLAAPK